MPSVAHKEEVELRMPVPLFCVDHLASLTRGEPRARCAACHRPGASAESVADAR